MTFSELLEAVRGAYTETLSQAVQQQASHVEPALRTADGALATEGELGLPCRVDAIVQQDGSSLTVDARSRLQFEPLQLQLAGTTVTMVPFTWDWLQLEVQGLNRDRVAHTLQDWFWQGFDAEDQNTLAADGLYGVLHFLSDLQPAGEGWRSAVDLGSAPAEALEELLWRLSDAGATQIALG